MKKAKVSCASRNFPAPDGCLLVVSETLNRKFISVRCEGEDTSYIEVLLNAEQFSELCGLGGYGGLEVHRRPDPEPAQADSAPVEG